MDRKEFLKTAAAGLIAASVPSVALRAVSRSPHKRPQASQRQAEPRLRALRSEADPSVHGRGQHPHAHARRTGHARIRRHNGLRRGIDASLSGRDAGVGLPLSGLARPEPVHGPVPHGRDSRLRRPGLLPTTGRPRLRSIWRCTIWSASCSDNRGTRYGVCRPKRRPTPRSRSASTRPRSSGKKSRKRLPTT